MSALYSYKSLFEHHRLQFCAISCKAAMFKTDSNHLHNEAK